MAARKLTAKQAAFVEAYDGNATAAARLAGYTGSPDTLAQTGSQLLRAPHVAEAIRVRGERGRPQPALEAAVASRAERQAFWTSVMQDPGRELNARLKASELLGKSEGDFLDRVEVGTTQTLEQLVAAAIAK